MFVAVEARDHQAVEEGAEACFHQDAAGEGLGVAQHLHDVGVLEDGVDRPTRMAREGGGAEFRADVALHDRLVGAVVAIDSVEIAVVSGEQGADLGEAFGKGGVGCRLGVHR
ncbi:hypothetical protein D3C80_1606020 [compost metagenome]